MKSDFHVDKNLMQLSETLEEKAPYAVLVVSTTGLDNKDFDKHSPTRVQLVEYEFDDEIQQYTASISFNKIVAADIEAVERAIAGADKYDVFASAAIDADSYKAQIQNPDLSADVPEDQRVLSQDEFRKQFVYAMTALEHDGTTLIVNGLEHSQKYLAKINCAEQLSAIAQAGKALDQPTLGGEYLISHGHGDLVKRNTATLENVRNVMTPVPNAAKQFDTPEMAKDFGELSKEDFLKAHPKTTPRAYDIKARDVEFRATKATAPERVEIINKFVTAYGREKGVLEDERQTQLRMQEKQKHDYLSAEAKSKYKNASLERKVQTQVEMGIINRDAVLGGDSQYQKLMEALSGENGKKGVAFIHVATSGLQNPRGNETGLPIQLFVRTANTDAEGKGLDTMQSKGYCFYMKVPESVVLAAQSQAEKGKFDVFKDAGIDVEQYKSGAIPISAEKKHPVMSEPQFVGLVNKLFAENQVNLDDYAVIALGGKGEKAFFQKALESVCNNPIVNAPTIDVIQAVTEYSLLTVEGQIPDNKIFGDNEVKGFGIRDIASAVGMELNGTGDKVNAAFAAASVMYEQYLELTKDEREQAKDEAQKSTGKENLEDFIEVEEIEAPVVIRDEDGNVIETENAQEISETETVPDENAPEEDTEPDFADEDGYDGESYVEDDIDEVREAFEQEGIEEFYDEFEKAEKPAPKSEPVQDSSDKENKVVSINDRPRRQSRNEPENRQPQERPQRVIPQPASEHIGNDVSKDMLFEMLQNQMAMNAQNQQTIQRLAEMNMEQSRIIAQADARLHEALSRQNDLLRDIAVMAFNTMSASTPAKSHSAQKNEVNPEKAEALDIMERLEAIKDDLTDIASEVSPNVSKCLQEANASITDGQQEYENPKRVDPKPVA